MNTAFTDPLAMSQLPLAPVKWFGETATRSEPVWSTEHEVLFENKLARLRDFSDRSAEGVDDVVPTLVLPPQAGHSSSIVDYNAKQSQMATILGAGLSRAYSLDWVPATQETKQTTVEDYIELIRQSIERIGAPVNLIGDCQGGWLATIYAALHPEDIHTLTLAGAPIDFHAGDGSIPANTQLMTSAFGMTPYRMLVAMGGGNMPGEAVLNGFIAIRPEAEIAKQLQLYTHLQDEEHLHRYREFEDWFKYTQDIPGTFYLWLVDHLFRRNELIRGELVVGGRRVDLSQITCPLYLLAGADDHITPPEQVWAAADAAGTPSEDVTYRLADGGHLGLFMGREALREHWPLLLADIHARSERRTSFTEDSKAARKQVRRGSAAEPPVPSP
jgi:poly(3-hydroxyalkanoate) synthetase